MLQQAQSFGYDVLKTTASVMAVDLTVKQPIKNMIPSNMVGASYAVDGVNYSLASDIVDYFTTGSSTIMDGRYFEFADNALYYGLLSGAVDQSGVALMTYKEIQKVSPLSQNVNEALTNGAIVSGGRVFMNMVDSNPATPDIMKMIRRPLTTISQKVM